MISKLIIHPQSETRENYASEILKKLNFTKSHPDLIWFEEDSKLGIEQARKIKDFLTLKPYQSKGQVVVVISAQNLTPEAQNALLKTFEEQSEGVNLILGAQSEEQLIPTLVSRCEIISLPIQSSGTQSLDKFKDEITKLMGASAEERFVFIEKLKDKDLFLKALVYYFRNNLNSKNHRAETLKFLKDLIQAEKWAGANVNIRAILEYLMLKLPKL